MTSTPNWNIIPVAWLDNALVPFETAAKTYQEQYDTIQKLRQEIEDLKDFKKREAELTARLGAAEEGYQERGTQITRLSADNANLTFELYQERAKNRNLEAQLELATATADEFYDRFTDASNTLLDHLIDYHQYHQYRSKITPV